MTDHEFYELDPETPEAVDRLARGIWEATREPRTPDEWPNHATRDLHPVAARLLAAA